MVRGDQIYVMRPLGNMKGIYEHHGIDCGDGTVIHYSKSNEAEIRRTSMAAFSLGQPVYVKRSTVAFIPDVVIERAESRLGERQYNLLSNNCEHFVNWCKTGRNESEQLLTYGLDLRQLERLNAGPLATEALQSSNPAQAIALYRHAMGNMTTAQTQLQTKIAHLHGEMNTWHRVAQTALQRHREDLARAALERKVALNREAIGLQEQLRQLLETEATLQRNYATLQGKIVVE